MYQFGGYITHYCMSMVFYSVYSHKQGRNKPIKETVVCYLSIYEKVVNMLTRGSKNNNTDTRVGSEKYKYTSLRDSTIAVLTSNRVYIVGEFLVANTDSVKIASDRYLGWAAEECLM